MSTMNLNASARSRLTKTLKLAASVLEDPLSTPYTKQSDVVKRTAAEADQEVVPAVAAKAAMSRNLRR